MLDKLKNMEPLSPQEENRIMWKLRAVVLVMAGLVLAFAIWSIVKKRDFTAVYYVIVSVFLFCNWFLIDVAPAFLCRALAGRSDKKVSAFLKMAGLGLLGNIGLGWFLMSMQNQILYTWSVLSWQGNRERSTMVRMTRRKTCRSRSRRGMRRHGKLRSIFRRLQTG